MWGGLCNKKVNGNIKERLYWLHGAMLHGADMVNNMWPQKTKMDVQDINPKK